MLIRRLLLDSIASTKENTTGSSSTGSYSGDGSFDSNMVIILAALLCALICALGLNSIVRCAIRCSHRFVFETPHQTAVRLAGTGMKKRALNGIPVVVYGGDDDIPATDCPICLAEFADGEKVRVLPECNHGFHVKCIDTWLLSRSSCPICRRSLCEIPACSRGDIGVRSLENGHGFVAVTVHEVS